jgi:hypothetical protein
MNFRSAIVKFGLGCVVVPAVALVLGMLLQTAIPGCRCDEGAGCYGCGMADAFLGLLIFGGFVFALLSAMFVLPLTLFLSWVIGRKADRAPTRPKLR